MADQITVETVVEAPVASVWKCWSEPACIMQWNNASPDWHTPKATNDLRTGGTFTSRMEAKDGSFGFDFGGTYSNVIENERIEYAMEDGRKVSVTFVDLMGRTLVSEAFDPESENSRDMQKDGWQAILDNFKKHAESHKA